VASWLALPTRVHYALQGLCYLACHAGPVHARDLARDEKIPAAQAAKLLYLLTWAGLVRSRRGSRGGFWLERPPESIRVREVLEFFHPPAARAGKAPDSIFRVWNDTVALSRRSFERLTIADLVAKNKSLPAARRSLRAAGEWAN
jgi:Rrf2 family transcriptional regulator, iron-sulfur cluster assembly transcription factor